MCHDDWVYRAFDRQVASITGHPNKLKNMDLRLVLKQHPQVH